MPIHARSNCCICLTDKSCRFYSTAGLEGEINACFQLEGSRFGVLCGSCYKRLSVFKKASSTGNVVPIFRTVVDCKGQRGESGKRNFGGKRINVELETLEKINVELQSALKTAFADLDKNNDSTNVRTTISDTSSFEKQKTETLPESSDDSSKEANKEILYLAELPVTRTLTDLLENVLDEIFNRLSSKDIINVTATCRSLYNFRHSDSTWKYRYLNEFFYLAKLLPPCDDEYFTTYFYAEKFSNIQNREKQRPTNSENIF